MKKYLSILLLVLSSISFAAETCPAPSSIKAGDFMSLTIYKAKDYQSKWFYEPNIKVTQFIKAEGSQDQLEECWYKAKNTETGKEIIMTLSPTILIAPDLKDPHWQLFKQTYFHCEGQDIHDCPLHEGKRLK